MQTLAVILIPLAGTVFGAAMALFMKKQLNSCMEKFLLGFASGVMIAASVWSLLIPSLERSEESPVSAVVGFMCGIVFLMILDTLIPHLHIYSGEQEGLNNNFSSHTMLFFAVTLHNFPEGMAVGAVLAEIISGTSDSGMVSAMVLAAGIAVQNFPEGAIISMPLRSSGMSRCRSFILGAISGLAEPAGAVLTILIASQMIDLLPYCLAFAAGAMIYVVTDELIPESRSDNCFNISTIGTGFGFSLMMLLDVCLG